MPLVSSGNIALGFEKGCDAELEGCVKIYREAGVVAQPLPSCWKTPKSQLCPKMLRGTQLSILFYIFLVPQEDHSF